MLILIDGAVEHKGSGECFLKSREAFLRCIPSCSSFSRLMRSTVRLVYGWSLCRFSPWGTRWFYVCPMSVFLRWLQWWFVLQDQAVSFPVSGNGFDIPAGFSRLCATSRFDDWSNAPLRPVAGRGLPFFWVHFFQDWDIQGLVGYDLLESPIFFLKLLHSHGFLQIHSFVLEPATGSRLAPWCCVPGKFPEWLLPSVFLRWGFSGFLLRYIFSSSFFVRLANLTFFVDLFSGDRSTDNISTDFWRITCCDWNQESYT